MMPTLPTSTPILQAQALCFSHQPLPAPPLFDGLNLTLWPGVTWLGGVSLAQERAAYQRQVAWLEPRDTALDALTCRQVFAEVSERHCGFDVGALDAHIAGLSLAPHLDKRLTMLSTGTRRKVLIAAALATQAPLTLLDQPFMALDRPSIGYLLDFLDEAARHPGRAWVVADYEAPEGVTLAGTIMLGA